MGLDLDVGGWGDGEGNGVGVSDLGPDDWMGGLELVEVGLEGLEGVLFG